MNEEGEVAPIGRISVRYFKGFTVFLRLTNLLHKLVSLSLSRSLESQGQKQEFDPILILQRTKSMTLAGHIYQ
jgi:hypothetical protein